MVFRRHRAGKIDRPAGDVRMHIDAAGKDDQATSIDHPRRSIARCSEPPGIINEQIPNDAINAISWIVNFAAGDTKHVVLTQ